MNPIHYVHAANTKIDTMCGLKYSRHIVATNISSEVSCPSCLGFIRYNERKTKEAKNEQCN